MLRISLATCTLVFALLIPRTGADAQSLTWQSISGVPGCITVKVTIVRELEICDPIVIQIEVQHFPVQDSYMGWRVHNFGFSGRR